MTPERWQQVEQLYFQALERAPEGRAVFLTVACAGNNDLRQEVEALLAADARAEHFIETPPNDLAAGVLGQAPAASVVGQRVGHYEMISLLGRGGMGEVYLAQDTRLHRRVALKLLRAGLTRDEQRVQRFEQEACAASALSHPNILIIHDLGQMDGLHYIATEYIEGETLRQLLKRSKITLGQAIEIGLQVAAALSATHAAGIVHRDIKPENIMLRPDGLVKVLDFGLAKLTEPLDPQAKASSLLRVETDPGMVLGTINYMSPEQARGSSVDARSDCFSLGVVLYEMLTGRPPFAGETVGDLLVAILEKEPPSLVRYQPELPAELQRIVTKALCKDREERYQTVKDLLLDLKSLKRNLEFERWQQVKNLVNSALAADAETRAAVLQQSCVDDLPLRRGAEALLSFQAEATRRFADLPAVQAAGQTPLSSEQWRRIESVAQAALARAPAERAAFLAQACGNDQALRYEVEALLVYQAAAGGLLQDQMPGALQHIAALPSHDALEVARLVPGTLLAKRYRIVGLLGRGGMGEVYRADDLKLGQPVALKFLTEKLSQDKAMLARFHSEVAMAHRVTHPNVCRVHDIGEALTSANALHFLSMEYVDGEDLSSLLRRIGRLPADKAVEIARQLCAGLAAAHEAGVLHRDLKPANVMLDGRGRVRITDFGLAGLAEQFRGQEVMAGTPTYLSPEQFAGKEVTVKSDLYALGLVLYEIFTGKRVFEAKSLEELRRLHESSSPANPSNWVKEIDPLVERVILRCLEKDPGRRPASAQQVADALPGGDLLQASLALDETPSPEMVAAAGEKTGLRPRVAVACLVAVIIGLFAAVQLRSASRLIDVIPFESPPEVLARKAREIVAQLGYPARPNDTAHGFEYDRRYLNYLQRQVPADARRQRFGQSRPAAIFFWHRESPQQLLPKGWPASPGARSGELPDVARVKEDDPPPTPGMISVRLDMQGRLIRLSAAPPQLDEAPSLPPSDKAAGDAWAGLFSAAGIDAARLTPAAAQWTPPSAFDARAAWTGTFPEQPDLALRVEAAAWHGKPVYFEVIGPWHAPERGAAIGSANRYSLGVFIIVALAVIFIGGLLAWRNLRRGRSDRKGAFRLSAFTFLGYIFAGLVGSFIPTLRPQELGIREALGSTAAIWVLYVALEPYVRRRWPATLISWSRVLAGSWRDPVVGRDVLFGILAGIGVVLIAALGQYLSPNLSAFSVSPDPLLRTLSGARQTVSLFVFLVIGSASFALALLFMLFLLRLLLRRDWLAVSFFTLLNAAPPLFTGAWLSAIWVGLAVGLLALTLTRFGLVTTASAYFVVNALINFPVTLDFSAWYAGTALPALVAILALAAFSFYTSLGGQKVLVEKLLEE